MITRSQIFLAVMSLALLTIPAHQAIAEEVDAQPIKRGAATMPEHISQSGHCEVQFDVSKEGATINVHTLFCTDNLFAENSIKAVQKWIFTPKKIDGIGVFRLEAQTKIIFKLADFDGSLIPEVERVDESIFVFDNNKTKATIKNQWPPYFSRPKKGEDSGFCCILYSVSQLGFTFNVEAQSCSHDKFASVADTVLRYWSYTPVTIDGKPVSSSGYEQVIHFAKRPRATIQVLDHYTPLPGKPEDFARYCRAMS